MQKKEKNNQAILVVSGAGLNYFTLLWASLFENVLSKNKMIPEKLLSNPSTCCKGFQKWNCHLVLGERSKWWQKSLRFIVEEKCLEQKKKRLQQISEYFDLVVVVVESMGDHQSH